MAPPSRPPGPGGPRDLALPRDVSLIEGGRGIAPLEGGPRPLGGGFRLGDPLLTGAQQLALLGGDAEPPLVTGPLGQFRVGTQALVADAAPIPLGEPMEFFGTVGNAEANFSIARLPEGQHTVPHGHIAVPHSVTVMEPTASNANPHSRHFWVEVRFRVFGEGYATVRMNGEQAREMGIRLDDIPRDGSEMSLIWQQRSLYNIEVTDLSASAPDPIHAEEISGGVSQTILFSERLGTADLYSIIPGGLAAVVIPETNPAGRMLAASNIPDAEVWVLQESSEGPVDPRSGNWRRVDPGSETELYPGQVFMLSDPLGNTTTYRLGADGNSYETVIF